MIPTAAIDLTEMVRLAMQRPERSPLFRAWEGGLFTWITCEAVLTEFVQVTDRPKFRRMIRPRVRDALVEAWRARAQIVIPAAEFPPCRDPQDAVVIAMAVAAGADFLVTADRDLLDDADLQAVLANQDVCVVGPAEFMAVLEGLR